jgi:hypothetical protein
MQIKNIMTSLNNEKGRKGGKNGKQKEERTVIREMIKVVYVRLQ